MRLINRVLRIFGLCLLPIPPSAKMLREYANVSECHHPSRGGNTVAWMHRAADAIVPDSGYRVQRPPRATRAPKAPPVSSGNGAD